MPKDSYKKDLSSSVVKAGHRVYFVDAKVDVAGSRFLAITEVKRSPKGSAVTRERQRIHIYEEDLPKILDAMGIALTALEQDKQKTDVPPKAQTYDAKNLLPHGGITPTSVEIPNLDDIVDLE